MREKKGQCKTCHTETKFVLTQRLFTSGAVHIVWVCAQCNRQNPDGSPQFFIPREKVLKVLSEDAIQALPVIMPDLFARCVVCGNRDAELHHWAPKFLFFDKYNDWPKDYLCRDCHELWHKTVTPQMTGGAQ